MQITLSQQLNSILQQGVDIVREYQQPILEKWESRLFELQEKQNKSAGDFEVVITLLSRCLFSSQLSIENIFQKMSENKRASVRSIEPNRLVFFITLLENGVHEMIQEENDNAYDGHQAVQYLFSKINEEIFSDTLKQEPYLDTFLEQLVRSRQLPIHWVAKLSKIEGGFQVQKVYLQTYHKVAGIIGFESESLFELSEYLLEFIPSELNENKVFPIPLEDHLLLFCSSEPESEVVPFIMFSMQTFLDGKDALRTTRRKRQWMDAVLLFNERIMRSKTYSETLKNIASGFVNYLPFERCALFAYSDANQSGIGLFAHSMNIEAIKSINENIDDLPYIKNYIKKLEHLGEHAKNVQPIYIAEAAIGLPEQYVEQFNLESIVLVPIYAPSENKLIGAAIVDQGPGKSFKLSRETFLALMKFGHSAGEVLVKYGPGYPLNTQAIGSIRLSPREIEVLQLISEGKSTNEAAQSLHLSEYTVRDYISTIMQKMEARNRTEAIVKAIREGII